METPKLSIFRAQRYDDKEWIRGSYIKTATGLHYIVPQNIIGNDVPQYLVDPRTLGQGLGLFDRDGKEMFNNDITELELEDGEKRLFVVSVQKVRRKVESHPDFSGQFAEVEITGVVFSWGGYELFPCVDENGVSDVKRMKIVGNTYENSELIDQF